MKKFNFRLEKCLKVRTMKEKVAKTKVMDAMKEVQEEKIALKNIVDNIEKERVRDIGNESVDFANHFLYIEWLKKCRMKQEDKVMLKGNIYAGKRDAWMIKKIDKDLVEKLKNRESSRWKKECSKRENCKNDDIVIRKKYFGG